MFNLKARSLALVLSIATAGAASLVAMPAAHATTTGASVTRFSYQSDPADPSDPELSGDYVGMGQSGTIDGGTATGTAGDVTFTVAGWRAELAAPFGQQLRPGRYDDAQRAPFRTAGHPGLAVTGNSRGCNTVTGFFVIHALTVDFHGQVTLLDADFEQHCEGVTPALHGQIRYNAPEPAPVIVSVTNNSVVTNQAFFFFAFVDGATSGSVTFSVDGVPWGGEFPIDADGLTVDPTKTPAAVGGAAPFTIGTHQIVASNGTSTSAPVTVTVRDGRKSFVAISGAGDFVGRGATASYSSPAESITQSRQGEKFWFHVVSGSDYWDVGIAPPTGQQFVATSYGGAHRFATATTAALDVTSNGRGCNATSGSFLIVPGYAGDGSLNSVDMFFTQFCDNSPASLSGTLHFPPTPTAMALASATTATPNSYKFTAWVVNQGSAPATVPTGTVSFYDGTTKIGSAPLNASSLASLTASLAPGTTHNIRADYAGDATHNLSSSNIVTILSSTTSLNASTTSTSSAKPVTLTATARDSLSWAAGGLTGTVTFRDGTTVLATVTLGTTDVVSLTRTFVHGDHYITATYNGDAKHIGSTSVSMRIRIR